MQHDMLTYDSSSSSCELISQNSAHYHYLYKGASRSTFFTFMLLMQLENENLADEIREDSCRGDQIGSLISLSSENCGGDQVS